LAGGPYGRGRFQRDRPAAPVSHAETL